MIAVWESAGAANDRFRGNICSEPSRMAKIFGSPSTAKNFENVSWWLFVGLRVSGFVWFVHLRISDFVVISRSPRNFVAFVVISTLWNKHWAVPWAIPTDPNSANCPSWLRSMCVVISQCHAVFQIFPQVPCELSSAGTGRFNWL